MPSMPKDVRKGYDQRMNKKVASDGLRQLTNKKIGYGKK